MRKPLVAGNWKMNGNQGSVDQLLMGLTKGDIPDGVEVAVFPPFVYLAQVAATLEDRSNIGWGAQNVSEHQPGAFTGEIAASMLGDLGCTYTLVGHSERRALYAETDGQVAEKFAAAHEARVMPVLCVGETQQQRKTGQTEGVIARQLQAVIDRGGLHAFTHSVIAYEPVWAIGTGLTATPEQAQEVHMFIRRRLGKVAEGIRIIYGGSVRADNAEALFQQPDIDGALVGGASLQSHEFIKICQLAAG